MKRILLIALGLACALPLFADDAKINTLTEKEKAAGWKLLFDGKDFAGWHNFQMDTVRPGWEVKDGSWFAPIRTTPATSSPRQFDWFELQLDYNISEAGNSGIMYHVNDAGPADLGHRAGISTGGQ
jgi:hypothetical protein